MFRTKSYILGLIGTLSLSSTAFAADQSLFTSQKPTLVNSSDGKDVNYELGMKFKSAKSGQIKAIRFYKGSKETGTHIGRIFSADGRQIASVTFVNESASGWQQQALKTPVNISANVQYMVSVNTGNTFYVDTVNGFRSAVSNSDLTGMNGYFGDKGVMPRQNYMNSNYFRDVVFAAAATTTPPPVVENPPTEPPPSNPPPVTNPPTNPPPVSSITHGQQLTLAMVGPAAIGINSFTDGRGGAIYDASSASYIKSINASATYDGFTVSGPHLLIQGVNITGTIDIYSSKPVVIRGCKIRGSGYWTVNTRSEAGAVYLLYSDVGGASAANPTDLIMGVSNNNTVAYRNHFSMSGGDGFSVGGKNLQVLENYIDQFIAVNGAHHDGLQAAGNNNGMVIARNKILLNMGETGTINLGPWAGVPTQVTIDSNYLAGGGYTVYGGGNGQNGIVVTNNIFGQDFYSSVGQWGPIAYWSSGSGNVWSNNRLSNGAVVNP